MITIQTICNSLFSLAKNRPFFWSEADFQFALSEALRMQLPFAAIRLERPFPINNNTTYHVDIWIEEECKVYPIELKYKTAKASVKIGNEVFMVKDQVAYDEGRYDFVADIKRIEEIKKHCSKTFGEGYAIILSNSPSYYDSSRFVKGKKTMDSDFRIHDGAILSGLRKWNTTANTTTVNVVGDRGSRKALTLAGNYTMDWKPYSTLKNQIDNTMFDTKYCVCVIK